METDKYKIFENRGLVGPPKNPKASSVEVWFDEEEFKKLSWYDGFEDVKFVNSLINLCISCSTNKARQKCSHCLVPLVCNEKECIQRLKHICHF
jgi:hypothetical protein